MTKVKYKILGIAICDVCLKPCRVVNDSNQTIGVISTCHKARVVHKNKRFYS